MSLLPPIEGVTITQGFGPSTLTVEPSMWAAGARAYWQPYRELEFFENFHPALDLGAPEGTPIRASENGVVTFSGWRDNGGGYCIEVEIRPNVRYESSHCSVLFVSPGVRVARGQTIALVGRTGTAFGAHDHFDLSIREVDQAGVARTFLWDPRLFLPGGSLANDPRIKPLPPPASFVAVNGPGINIRWRPDLSEYRFVWAVARSDGIWRLKDDTRHCDLDQRLKFGGWVTNQYGIWARVFMGGAYRYALKELIHFV